MSKAVVRYYLRPAGAIVCGYHPDVATRRGVGWTVLMAAAGVFTLPAGAALVVVVISLMWVSNGCQTLELPQTPCTLGDGLSLLGYLAVAVLIATGGIGVWRVRRGESTGYLGIGWAALGLFPAVVIVAAALITRH